MSASSSASSNSNSAFLAPVPVPDFRPGLGDNHGDGFEFDASQAYGGLSRAAQYGVQSSAEFRASQVNEERKLELELLGMGFPVLAVKDALDVHNHQTVFAAAAAAAAATTTINTTTTPRSPSFSSTLVRIRRRFTVWPDDATATNLKSMPRT